MRWLLSPLTRAPARKPARASTRRCRRGRRPGGAPPRLSSPLPRATLSSSNPFCRLFFPWWSKAGICSLSLPALLRARARARPPTPRGLFFLGLRAVRMEGGAERPASVTAKETPPVYFVETEALLSGRQDSCRRDNGGAAGACPAAAPPNLLARVDGVDCFDLNAEDLLGAAYDSTEAAHLPNWAEEGDMSDVSSASDELSDASASSSAGGNMTHSEESDGAVPGDADWPPLPPGRSAAARPSARRRPGFQSDGKWRKRGPGLQVRTMVQPILVVLFCRQLISTLELREAADDGSKQLPRTLVADITALRAKYNNVTDAAMVGKVWALRRSGVVGALLKVQDRAGMTARRATLASQWRCLSRTRMRLSCVAARSTRTAGRMGAPRRPLSSALCMRWWTRRGWAWPTCSAC